jgi:hypothetical protein
VTSSSSTPEHPVELARLLVGAGQEHAAHVQEHHGHHAVRAPAVHVAQEDAEGHRAAQIEHAVVGLRGGGHVVEHQQDAGGHQDEEQKQRDQPQAQRVDAGRSVFLWTLTGWMCRKKLVKLVDARSRSVEGRGLRKMELQTLEGISRRALHAPFSGVWFRALGAHTFK